jgi:hypothetical protein
MPVFNSHVYSLFVDRSRRWRGDLRPNSSAAELPSPTVLLADKIHVGDSRRRSMPALRVWLFADNRVAASNAIQTAETLSVRPPLKMMVAEILREGFAAHTVAGLIS